MSTHEFPTLHFSASRVYGSDWTWMLYPSSHKRHILFRVSNTYCFFFFPLLFVSGTEHGATKTGFIGSDSLFFSIWHSFSDFSFSSQPLGHQRTWEW